MDNEKEKTSSSSYLQSEIIEEEILTRVSVKAALRLRCVSKSWRSLIDSKLFINKHSQNSTRQCRVIANYLDKEGIFYLKSSNSYLGDDKPCDDDDPSPIDDDPLGRKIGSLLLGHCNGLLCVFDLLEKCFFLWNPATRRIFSLELPKIIQVPKIGHDGEEKFKYGFGWDEQSGAYKVFVSSSRAAQAPAQVYSSNTNSWTQVERGCDSMNNGFGVFAYGKIHWITTSGHIECFDLKNHVFETINMHKPLPCNCKPRKKECCVWLWEWRGRLYFVCYPANPNTTRRVWVMNKNKNGDEDDEFNWVEDQQVNSQLGNDISGCNGASSYIQTLVSP